MIHESQIRLVPQAPTSDARLHGRNFNLIASRRARAMKYGVKCGQCGAWTLKEGSAIGRAERAGSPLYCGRACAGLARRLEVQPTVAERRAAKADYDAEYRGKNRARLKAEKAAYYARTADREKERETRRARMPQHVEYCRRPEYRKWKADYDRKYLAEKHFGPFAEAALVLRDLENEVLARIDRTEIYRQNGTLNKKQTRRRDYDQAVGS